MTTRSITLDLPGPLYERLARRAREAHRSVEDELLEVVATAVPPGSVLPEALLPATESAEDDPLEAFIGALPSDIADWGDDHDQSHPRMGDEPSTNTTRINE